MLPPRTHARTQLRTAHPRRGFRTSAAAASPTVISRLPNGVRVASQESLGHFVAAGVYVDTGSKFETPATAGISHVLDRMAFKSTKGLSSPALVKELESLGGNVLAHSSREGLMYQATVFRHDLAKMMSIYGQIVRDPLFLDEEVEETKESTRYELREIAMRPDTALSEAVHSLAFQADPTENERSPLVVAAESFDVPRTNTLGNSLLVGDAALDAMTGASLREFHRTWFTPDRIVVAGVGMDHARLEDLAAQEFGSLPPATADIVAAQQACTQAPRYTGGMRVVDTSAMPPSPNPDDRPLTHVHLAFESVSMLDPDIYALATLTSLMGGGGSFSAGGPGKGMYTRLYTRVLNHHSWVDACSMVNYTYNDTGLLSIQAAVIPDKGTHHYVLPVLAQELLGTTTVIEPSELSRAKNQLKSNLLMSLESKIVELEDVGRQVLTHNRRLDVLEMCRRIDKLEPADLIRVARRVFFGEDIQSPLDFNDPLSKHWVRTGNGEATLLAYGPLVKDDALQRAPEELAHWGLGRAAATAAAARTGVTPGPKSGRRSWFSRQ
ncbi:Mitochondrial-processing peptidase subunit alpha [Polyrhizophydium stewartii]|uniref:Alpha-MPP n=1 Tax=Polyrhizophydium stewartii TaxID=2732419 RepID=A0ABR4N2E4_9FUNG|nr:Mitochondrial-processing peptidase subunit alpha [Polyrhizophydium stewartii]